MCDLSLFVTVCIAQTDILALSCFSYSSGDPTDASDIAVVLARHWNTIDINRVPEDIERFIQVYPQSQPAWGAVRARYS